MEKILKMTLVITFLLSLFGCSRESKLIGTWENEKGMILEFTKDELLITREVFNGFDFTGPNILDFDVVYKTDTSAYVYELGDDNKITIYYNGNGYVTKYSLNNNVLSFFGELADLGEFKKVSKNTKIDKDDGQKTNETYLSKEELDETVFYEFENFVTNYSNDHTDKLYGFLDEPLRCEKVTEHKYNYHYVYLIGEQSSYVRSFEVLKLSITANADKTYSIDKEERTGEWVYLKSVNTTSMNVRRGPSTSSEIIGSIDTGERFRVNHMNFEDFSKGGEYIWYSLSAFDARWIADGRNKDKDYYVFDNGASTKYMSLDYGQRIAVNP